MIITLARPGRAGAIISAKHGAPGRSTGPPSREARAPASVKYGRQQA